ncbi:MAG: YfhO family protein [Candidatus Aminicenantes bacterium]
MNRNRLKTCGVRILLFILFFGLISLVVEIAFFNKDFFCFEKSLGGPPFDYYWIRHLAVFLVFVLWFVIRKRKITVKDIKSYGAVFLLLVNIIPVVCFLSKYLTLFFSFLLFLFIKTDGDAWKYKRLLRRNLHIMVFFFVLFILFFPLLFKEGFVYDPLSLFYRWPGYRLSRVRGLETKMGTSDLFDAFFPQWKYTYASLKAGTLPLWRYNKGLGVPVYGQYDHPERFIAFIVKPHQALTLQVLLKLFLSMTGMFFLLRTLRVKNLLCMTGGIAFALSGFIIGWLHGPQSSVIYHIPFLFLFLVKYLQSDKIKFLFYFALTCSLAISSGFLAVAGYAFYAVGLFLLLFFLFDPQKLFPRIKKFLKASLFWLVGIIMVSFNFIPLYYSFFIKKSFHISYRQIGRVNFLSPKYLMNIIFPSYHGWKISPEVRPYVSSILIFFLITGLAVFILKLMNVKGRIRERERFFLIFLLLLVPFAMAMFGLFPFYQISCRLPVLNSSPLSRLQSITSFFLVAAGVLGLELFIRSYRKILDAYQKRKWVFSVIVEVLFLSFLFAAVISFVSDEEARIHTTYPVFILLALVVLTFQLSVFFKRKANFFLLLLLFLVSGETILQNSRYIPVNEKEHFITEIETPLIAFLKENLKSHEGVLVFDSNYNINGTLGNYGIREMVVHEFHRHDYRALILDTFSPRSFVTPTAPALASQSTDFSSSFIQLMGVKFLVFRSEFKGEGLPPYFSLVYSNLDGRVYVNNLHQKNKGIFFCRPRYYSLEEKGQVIKDIKSMDYSNHVYIQRERRMRLHLKDNMSCRVDIIEYTPNRVIYGYHSNSEGILTFPEAFDRDWSATVNGKKTRVLKTNLVFRGVPIRKGRGRIVFEYHIPQLYKILAWVGLAVFLVLVGLYLSFKEDFPKP